MLGEMLVRDLAEQCLLERALNGDKEADTEVSARAMAGSFRCQVGLLHALGTALSDGRISTDYYLERAEVLARMAAASGNWVERRRLAALLDVKAVDLRERGSDNASKTAHIECAIILNRLADEGDDEAVTMLNNFSPDMHTDSLAVANMGLKATRPALQPPAKPAPPAPDPEPSVGEQIASILALGPEWEPTRRERLGWWISDRWWGVRGWVDDRVWSVRLFWWSVQDRVAALREGAE